MEQSYQLSIYDRVLDHFRRARLVRDAAEVAYDEDELELKAHVSSGDYFVMLATRLDHLSDVARAEAPEVAVELQRLVRQLMRLQQNYQISVKK